MTNPPWASEYVTYAYDSGSDAYELGIALSTYIGEEGTDVAESWDGIDHGRFQASEVAVMRFTT